MGNLHSADRKARKYMSDQKKSHGRKRSQSLNKSKPHILVTKTTAITDDYDLLTKKEIGQGISGKVILCRNRLTRRKYALKKVKDSRSARREIEIQWKASQNFDHIVRIIDVYENKIRNESFFFIIMEYMEGGELFKKIRSRKKQFTEFEVAQIMHQIVATVQHLHNMGIAHRDLKPENLLLATKSEEHFIIKLCDFGFAKEANGGLLTPNFTPYYVAPEILRFEKYDISCDIWSLGVIMYILCCGYPPFYSMNGHHLSPGMEERIKNGEFSFRTREWEVISSQAKDLIRGMLETDIDKRLSIDDIMHSDWIKNYSNQDLKKRCLDSVANLQKEANMSDATNAVTSGLIDLRVNYDVDFKVKNLPEANNKLLQRRKDKLASLKEESTIKIKLNSPKDSPKSLKGKANKTGLIRSNSLPDTNSAITALYYSSNLNPERKNSVVYADHEKNFVKPLKTTFFLRPPEV